MLNVNIKESDWPEWANWVAQDKTGCISFFEIEPSNHLSDFEWCTNGKFEFITRSSPNPNWKKAIMKRPAITGNKSSEPVTSLSVLKEVSKIQVDRGAIYEGQEQERSMAKIVAIFNLHHDTNLTEPQGWHFMEILKNVRLFNAQEYHHDSGVDGVSYAALKVEAKAKEKQ